jgi:hypothetical protein
MGREREREGEREGGKDLLVQLHKCLVDEHNVRLRLPRGDMRFVSDEKSRNVCRAQTDTVIRA